MSFNEGILVHLDAGLIQFRDGLPAYNHTMNYPAIFQKLRNDCLVLHVDLSAWDRGTLPQSEGRIHVVCSPKKDYLAVMTAYLPQPDQWAPDYRRRR